MADDIFKLRKQEEPLPVEEQDVPTDVEGQWRLDFSALHGRPPNANDYDDWQWSLRFAGMNQRAPERQDFERHFYEDLGKRGTPTTKAQASRENTPEFVARPSSGIGRDRLGDLIVPFPWQADEPGAETDMTARFKQYDKWDAERGRYPRGTPEWNSLTTAMNQLQTSSGTPWYFSFTTKFGLRDEILKIAGNRTGADRVKVVSDWIQQKQGQGVDPFNQADPYSAAIKAAAKAASTSQQSGGGKAPTQTGEENLRYEPTFELPGAGLVQGSYPGVTGQDYAGYTPGVSPVEPPPVVNAYNVQTNDLPIASAAALAPSPEQRQATFNRRLEDASLYRPSIGGFLSGVPGTWESILNWLTTTPSGEKPYEGQTPAAQEMLNQLPDIAAMARQKKEGNAARREVVGEAVNQASQFLQEVVAKVKGEPVGGGTTDWDKTTKQVTRGKYPTIAKLLTDALPTGEAMPPELAPSGTPVTMDRRETSVVGEGMTPRAKPTPYQRGVVESKRRYDAYKTEQKRQLEMPVSEPLMGAYNSWQNFLRSFNR